MLWQGGIPVSIKGRIQGRLSVRPTPVRTSPGVVGALPVIPFGALNRNPSNPAACRGKWRKKHFRETKNLDSIRETAETYKYVVATILFHNFSFRRGIFWSDGPRLPSFDRTATNMRNLKKKLRTRREFVDTWHAQLQTWRVKYITSICDHRTKIFKKVEQNFTFCDRTFYNKSKTARFQADYLIYYSIRKCCFNFQVACFELPRVRSFNFEFPQVQHEKSAWNRPVLLLW